MDSLSLFERKGGERRRRQESMQVSPLLAGILAGLFAVAGGIVVAVGGPLAAIALLAAGTTAFVVLRNLEIGMWGIIAVICLLPFATIPIDLGVTPTFLDVALGAVVGVWLLRLATGAQRRVVTSPITVPLIAFMIVALFAFVFGLGNGPLTPGLLRRFAELLLSLGFVMVVVDYCRSWEQLERLVKVFIVAGAAAATAGIFLWLLPDETANLLLNSLQRLGYPGGWVIRYIEENPELAERAIGTAIDPNSFGGLLVLIGALVGPQIVSHEPILPRWVSTVCLGLVFVALVLTFSRGAMLGLVAGLGIVAVLRYRRFIPYLAIAALLFLLLPVTQGYISRFVAGIQGQDLATQMRFGEYRDALTLISRYPLFGVGFSGSPDIDLYLSVASVYLTIAGRMGFLGLIAFLVLMATVFGCAYVRRKQFVGRPRRVSVWLGLHAALIGGLVTGVFDHYLFNIEFHHAVTAFWFLVGLATASTRLGASSPG